MKLTTTTTTTTTTKTTTLDIQISTYDNMFKQAFGDLNLEWIRNFFAVETKDLEQVENPERCLQGGGQIFFLVHKGRAVATCAMYNAGSKRFELAKMAVDPQFRGHGLGDVLIHVAETWAVEQGAEEIFMLSNTILEPAIRLYKKHGYEVRRLGPHPDYARCNIELRKKLRS
jgi:GNAT superfamily N-acetyltransferase